MASKTSRQSVPPPSSKRRVLPTRPPQPPQPYQDPVYEDDADEIKIQTEFWIDKTTLIQGDKPNEWFASNPWQNEVFKKVYNYLSREKTRKNNNGKKIEYSNIHRHKYYIDVGIGPKGFSYKIFTSDGKFYFINTDTGMSREIIIVDKHEGSKKMSETDLISESKQFTLTKTLKLDKIAKGGGIKRKTSKNLKKK